jgi:hypothetical protein
LDTKFFSFFSAGRRHARIAGVERYVLRGGRWGYDRLRILTRVRRAETLELLVIAVEDADFDGLFCHPPSDGFDFYRRMLPRVVELNGGDAAIGRKLYRYFLLAGLQTVCGSPRTFELWARRPLA